MPLGVEGEVVIVTAPLDAEYEQLVPVGRFKQLAETLVAEVGSVTGKLAVEPAATEAVGEVKLGAVPLPVPAESISN